DRGLDRLRRRQVDGVTRRGPVDGEHGYRITPIQEHGVGHQTVLSLRRMKRSAAVISMAAPNRSPMVQAAMVSLSVARTSMRAPAGFSALTTTASASSPASPLRCGTVYASMTAGPV